jgi:hypothetical protein
MVRMVMGKKNTLDRTNFREVNERGILIPRIYDHTVSGKIPDIYPILLYSEGKGRGKGKSYRFQQKTTVQSISVFFPDVKEPSPGVGSEGSKTPPGDLRPERGWQKTLLPHGKVAP